MEKGFLEPKLQLPKLLKFIFQNSSMDWGDGPCVRALATQTQGLESGSPVSM